MQKRNVNWLKFDFVAHSSGKRSNTPCLPTETAVFAKRQTKTEKPFRIPLERMLDGECWVLLSLLCCSTTCDCIIFMFLGIALVRDDHMWNWGFVIGAVVLCLIVRFLSKSGLNYQIIKRHRSRWTLDPAVWKLSVPCFIRFGSPFPGSAISRVRVPFANPKCNPNPIPTPNPTLNPATNPNHNPNLHSNPNPTPQPNPKPQPQP